MRLCCGDGVEVTGSARVQGGPTAWYRHDGGATLAKSSDSRSRRLPRTRPTVPMPVPRSLVVVGLVAWAGGLSWFGRLPGDVRVERGNVRVYAPIASMLLVSLVLTVLLRVLRRFR